ncbi:SIMPL domain-containing protein [Leucobacter sp. UT-8R-CII-1-4]|uniref:SIMPL domain-containing protein n=1 Tax=Leucobacter sp. UT-8R-CII-1-4 TaxID=3040075 RepID=UPI0024A9FC85|nr:SIMPL domain-containing protein [Leucobacter sp. UT-8R-CII-1-4]MDI6023850.1 SIMPL domain-containing protein [Leucobacter sp. UT-8R-CII-1-4]
MSQIHATGTHDAHYRAERATITASVSVASKDRGRSITDATTLHNSIAQRAQQLRDAGDATWHAADAPSTWARKSYAEGAGQQVVIEHVTSSRVRIKLSNLDQVGPLVEELSVAGAETSVHWSLTEASRRLCERQARRAAVGTAREIAEDYAEALGEQIVRVVSISDVLAAGFGGPQPRFAMAASYGGESAEVSVAEITVSATVQGVFESA